MKIMTKENFENKLCEMLAEINVKNINSNEKANWVIRKLEEDFIMIYNDRDKIISLFKHEDGRFLTDILNFFNDVILKQFKKSIFNRNVAIKHDYKGYIYEDYKIAKIVKLASIYLGLNFDNVDEIVYALMCKGAYKNNQVNLVLNKKELTITRLA